MTEFFLFLALTCAVVVVSLSLDEMGRERRDARRRNRR